ncbi:hypothetical protein BDZ97DRAFT_1915732 [Flammula alnicola]|nr:hypothetical protein BDZ97DRAFT_1915732 [Flammula alnicola]
MAPDHHHCPAPPTLLPLLVHQTHLWQIALLHSIRPADKSAVLVAVSKTLVAAPPSVDSSSAEPATEIKSDPSSSSKVKSLRLTIFVRLLRLHLLFQNRYRPQGSYCVWRYPPTFDTFSIVKANSCLASNPVDLAGLGLGESDKVMRSISPISTSEQQNLTSSCSSSTAGC